MGLSHKNVDVTAIPKMEVTKLHETEQLKPHIVIYVPAYEQRLRTLIRLARDASIDPVLITQPALYGDSIDLATGVDLGSIRIGSSTGKVHWAILELYNEATRKIAEEEKVFVVDLAHELVKSSDYFYDYMHFTNTGSAEVAKIIQLHLTTYLRQKYPHFRKAQSTGH